MPGHSRYGVAALDYAGIHGARPSKDCRVKPGNDAR